MKFPHTENFFNSHFYPQTQCNFHTKKKYHHMVQSRLSFFSLSLFRFTRILQHTKNKQKTERKFKRRHTFSLHQAKLGKALKAQEGFFSVPEAEKKSTHTYTNSGVRLGFRKKKDICEDGEEFILALKCFFKKCH